MTIVSEFYIIPTLKKIFFLGPQIKEKGGVMFSNGTLEFSAVKSKIRTPVSKPCRVQRINLSTNW